MKFDKIYCINIDKRTDKWEQCISHFTDIGIIDRVERFSAVVPDNTNIVERGVIGCRESHIQCIKQAKADGVEHLLMLEDDVQFTITDFNIIEQYLTPLNSLNWQMIYFGGNLQRSRKVSRENEHIFKLHSGCLTTHCYGMHHSAYDDIIKRYEEVKSRPIRNPQDCQKYAIDAVYQLLAKEGIFNTYHSSKFLCDQRQGFSDIRGGDRDYKIKQYFDSSIKRL